ncbi:MAG: terpene cyclase/mutase family protein [Proteobacteria bacterium]|nr:terpene cyclase/mutase family protein [Pseudomonadota bacterium]
MTAQSVISLGRQIVDFARTPFSGKTECLKDRKGLPSYDPGPSRCIDEAINWLVRAQDYSSTGDGGVARHYSYRKGWGPSYPETTGYIIPTIIKYASGHKNEDLMNRAEQMLDWLVSIQFSEGGFQAGTMNDRPAIPCTFNTGQILLGLAAGVRTFGNRYKKPMNKAANWLVATQDEDGCWRKFPTPFAAPGDKTYETHVAWGLLEAADADSNATYLSSALLNVDWAVRHQHDNGWFGKCCLEQPDSPLTHTLGYVFRGILEAYIRTRKPDLFQVCRKLSDGLLVPLGEDGFIPGRLSADWEGTVSWACLTGSAQIAYCWFVMYRLTGNKTYVDAALSVNRYIRRTQHTEGPDGTRGGIKGSFPVSGDYGKYEYLNWAAKFFIDANIMELELNDDPSASPPR